MKKVIYLVVMVVMLSSCSTKPHYTIKGNIAGSESIMFYLQKRDAGRIVSIDSAVSRKGSFTMNGGAIDYPQLVQLVAGNTRKRASFYLENSEINITGSLDSLANAKVTGSKTQDEYMDYVNSTRPLSEKYSKLVTQYQIASQTGNVAAVATLEKQLDSIQIELSDLQKNFIRTNPKSYVTPSLVVNLSIEMDADEIESMINGLDSTIVALPQMQILKARIDVMKSVAIGKKAPDFTLNDVNGNPVSLSSKIGGAKLLLIDFWAGWCNPCRQENPNVVKVYNEFHKKGFDIMGVSLDQTKEQWVKAIADDKLVWTNVSDLQYWNNATAKLYAVYSIPANFLLDETGTIVAKNLRGEALYNKVNEVLGGKK